MMLRFQSLVWWIRGFKMPMPAAMFRCGMLFQSLVWWIRGFKPLALLGGQNNPPVSILGLVDKGF